ncbi:reticulon-3-B-like isoform X2 [Pimephales promelas]|uniref:reticulon-3-B-like isoform X2 n=1 Tax=Pimephales promelas TaxID=90988 RepID=UPI0019556B08|nr:reticulon-3-B-like isoform X2 [Pimephales promelas]
MADPAVSSSSGLNSIVLLKDSNSSVQDWTTEKDHEGLLPCFKHPYVSAVQELVYWQEPKKSSLVFGGSMLVLTSLARFSVISVVSYLLLALLCVTITFRVYKSVVHAVQKSDEGHPFKFLMERDIRIPPDTAHRYMDMFLEKLNTALIQTRRLVLVEDVVDSLKLAAVVWFLTCVGAVFNGITILILADVVLFCTPLLYERNKTQIDAYLVRVQCRLEEKLAKLQDKLPGPVKWSKAE